MVREHNIVVVETIQKVIHHEDRIFRWWSNGDVEYCNLNQTEPIFKPVGREPIVSFTINDTDSVTGTSNHNLGGSEIQY